MTTRQCLATVHSEVDMKRFDTELLSIDPVASGYYRISFRWDSHAGIPAPGAFLTVKVGSGLDPVLRRPFAFSSYDGESASFIFQERGRGTKALAALKPGSALDVLGPLGKGFANPPAGSQPVLVAGGIGLGPMLYLAKSLMQSAAKGEHRPPLLVLGFRSKNLCPSLPGLVPEGAVLCTDDGSRGFAGTVADFLKSYRSNLPICFYACGPAPMMAAVAERAVAINAPFQAATEQWMACGVGACMGCAVAMKDGSYQRACAEGPVFDGLQVDWRRA